MTLIARAVRALAAASPERLPLSSSWQTTSGMLGGGTTTQEAYLRAYGQVGWLFAVVNRISEGVAQLRWHGYEPRPDGKREERPDHPAVRLWRDVNDFYTTFEFVETFSQHYELVGEAWWVLLDGPGGEPVEMWPVRPDRMFPVPSRESYIAGYIYRSPLDGQPIPLARESVIFLRRPNPLDPYRGAGMVQTILADLEGERMAALWNRNFFYNSAEPGGIIEYEHGLTEPEFQKQVLRWREQHQGVANAHRVALIEKGKWVDRKLSQRDMQFKDLRITNRDAILGAAGIPKAVLGISDDVNRANAEAGEVVFGRWIIRPRAERIKQALNERLAVRFSGKPIEFDYEDPTPANREQALKEAMDGLTARIMTIAEARQKIGMDSPPPEELQQLALACSAEALGALIRAGFDPIDALRALGLAPVKHLGLAPVTVQPADGTGIAQPAQRALKSPGEDPPLEALPSPFDDAELAMQRAWARRLAQERDALIEYVGEYKTASPRQKIEVSDLSGYDWGWWEKYGAEVVAEISAAFILAAQAQAPEWTPTLAQQAAQAWARARGAELLKLDGEVNVVRLTQRRVGELVAQTIERGDSLQKLQKALREDFAFSRERAENIARTETATSLGVGGKAGAVSQGMDEKRWVTQGDSHVEAECIANAAVGWIPINKLFPGGKDHVPQHNMCRCKTGYRHTPLAGPEADGPPRMLAEARCPRCRKMLETDVPAGTALWCRRCKRKVLP